MCYCEDAGKLRIYVLDSIVAQLLFYKMIKSFCNIYYTLATATMLCILAEKNMFKIPLSRSIVWYYLSIPVLCAFIGVFYFL